MWKLKLPFEKESYSKYSCQLSLSQLREVYEIECGLINLTVGLQIIQKREIWWCSVIALCHYETFGYDGWQLPYFESL